MLASVQEHPHLAFKFLPTVKAVSGESQVVNVIRANTSHVYIVVPDQTLGLSHALFGSTDALATRAPISNTFGSTYSLTITTSDLSDEYNPEMVAALLKADAEPPVATFTNVVDMMEWLERD
jgi:hypothetical protein